VKNRQDSINQLRSLSKTLDLKYNGPLGLKIGLDGILGFIPGVGDFITTAISLYVIAQAANLGVGSATLIRMAINVGIDNLIDMVPILGNFFDFYWHANVKNLQLLEEHLVNPSRETIKSRMVVVLICLALLIILVASGYISFVVIESIYHWVSSQRVN
jgi:hypothetical protein